jgi:class 3 adenylate cyclase
MPNLPTGTVTFAFSDIEGSTALLKRLGDRAYGDLIATHRRLVREIFAAHDGLEIDTQGDAFFYSFTRAREAVAAAVELQRAHADAAWPEGVSVRVRLGLHTGEPVVGDEGYTGLDVVRASRIAAVGRGGQVLLSDTTRAIVAGDLPDGVSLRALGDRRLRDIDRPEPLTELVMPGIESRTESETEVGLAEAGSPEGPGWPLDPGASPPEDIPEWVQRAAQRFLPGGPTRDLIEQRVLGALEEAFNRRDARVAGRLGEREPSAKPQPRRRGRSSRARGEPAGASVSREIERLRELRDEGALSDEQYQRAVDQVIDRQA